MQTSSISLSDGKNKAYINSVINQQLQVKEGAIGPTMEWEYLMEDAQAASASSSSIELEIYDVICGRGKGPRNHPGNVRFQEILTANLQRYCNAPSLKARRIIVAEITQIVKSKGRFLIQKNKKWQMVTDTAATQKVNTSLYYLIRLPKGNAINTKEDYIGADAKSILPINEKSRDSLPIVAIGKNTNDDYEVVAPPEKRRKRSSTSTGKHEMNSSTIKHDRKRVKAIDDTTVRKGTNSTTKKISTMRDKCPNTSIINTDDEFLHHLNHFPDVGDRRYSLQSSVGYDSHCSGISLVDQLLVESNPSIEKGNGPNQRYCTQQVFGSRQQTDLPILQNDRSTYMEYIYGLHSLSDLGVSHNHSHSQDDHSLHSRSVSMTGSEHSWHVHNDMNDSINTPVKQRKRNIKKVEQQDESTIQQYIEQNNDALGISEATPIQSNKFRDRIRNALAFQNLNHDIVHLNDPLMNTRNANDVAVHDSVTQFLQSTEHYQHTNRPTSVETTKAHGSSYNDDKDRENMQHDEEERSHDNDIFSAFYPVHPSIAQYLNSGEEIDAMNSMHSQYNQQNNDNTHKPQPVVEYIIPLQQKNRPTLKSSIQQNIVDQNRNLLLANTPNDRFEPTPSKRAFSDAEDGEKVSADTHALSSYEVAQYSKNLETAQSQAEYQDEGYGTAGIKYDVAHLLQNLRAGDDSSSRSHSANNNIDKNRANHRHAKHLHMMKRSGAVIHTPNMQQTATPFESNLDEENENQSINSWDESIHHDVNQIW